MRITSWLGRLRSQIRTSRFLGQTRQRRQPSVAGTQIEALEHRVYLSAVSWDGGGDGVHWSDPLNWSSNALPGATDDVTINFGNATVSHDSGNDSIHSLTSANKLSLNGGTLAINGPATISSDFTLSGGDLSGTGDVTVSGVLAWTGGRMDGTGRTIVSAAGILNMSVASDKFLDRVLVSNGTGTWTAGLFRMNGGTFQNNGTFTATTSGTLESFGDGGVNSVVNAGTFNEQGTGTTRFRGNNADVAFSNSGTVNVQQGTLQLMT
ncbi:MAG: repeat-containing protein, partial [Planctomycetaceae bacterium]|nr:repeat-containing protein [Planctomycetaceae bacterium]